MGSGCRVNSIKHSLGGKVNHLSRQRKSDCISCFIQGILGENDEFPPGHTDLDIQQVGRYWRPHIKEREKRGEILTQEYAFENISLQVVDRIVRIDEIIKRLYSCASPIILCFYGSLKCTFLGMHNILTLGTLIQSLGWVHSIYSLKHISVYCAKRIE